MAEMTYRESNQIKWVGTRPGHNGTQVLKSLPITNNYGIVYTVPAASVFYMTYCSLSVVAPAASYCRVFIRTDGAVLVANLFYIYCAAAMYNGPITATFNPPIEIPAGYQVMIHANIAALTADACVHGWVEAA